MDSYRLMDFWYDLDLFYYMPAWTEEEVSSSDLSFTSVVE